MKTKRKEQKEEQKQIQKAALYCRVSTAEQLEGTSLDQQEDSLIKWCA